MNFIGIACVILATSVGMALLMIAGSKLDVTLTHKRTEDDSDPR